MKWLFGALALVCLFPQFAVAMSGTPVGQSHLTEARWLNSQSVGNLGAEPVVIELGRSISSQSELYKIRCYWSSQAVARAQIRDTATAEVLFVDTLPIRQLTDERGRTTTGITIPTFVGNVERALVEVSFDGCKADFWALNYSEDSKTTLRVEPTVAVAASEAVVHARDNIDLGSIVSMSYLEGTDTRSLQNCEAPTVRVQISREAHGELLYDEMVSIADGPSRQLDNAWVDTIIEVTDFEHHKDDKLLVNVVFEGCSDGRQRAYLPLTMQREMNYRCDASQSACAREIFACESDEVLLNGVCQAMDSAGVRVSNVHWNLEKTCAIDIDWQDTEEHGRPELLAYHLYANGVKQPEVERYSSTQLNYLETGTQHILIEAEFGDGTLEKALELTYLNIGCNGDNPHLGTERWIEVVAESPVENGPVGPYLYFETKEEDFFIYPHLKGWFAEAFGQRNFVMRRHINSIFESHEGGYLFKIGAYDERLDEITLRPVYEGGHLGPRIVAEVELLRHFGRTTAAEVSMDVIPFELNLDDRQEGTLQAYVEAWGERPSISELHDVLVSEMTGAVDTLQRLSHGAVTLVPTVRPEYAVLDEGSMSYCPEGTPQSDGQTPWSVKCEKEKVINELKPSLLENSLWREDIELASTTVFYGWPMNAGTSSSEKYIWVDSLHFDRSSILHELLHQFGLSHAGFLTRACADSQGRLSAPRQLWGFQFGAPWQSDCWIYSYGHSLSTMATGFGLSVADKIRLGWLPSSALTEVRSTRSFTVVASDIADAAQADALEIPLNKQWSYIVEYRQGNVDEIEAAGLTSPRTMSDFPHDGYFVLNLTDNVFKALAVSGSNTPSEAVVGPEVNRNHWVPGDSFYDSHRRIRINFGEKYGETAEVEVLFDVD